MPCKFLKEATEMKYNTILIDLDDTLIDTIGNTETTIREIYNDYNLNEHFSSFDEFFVNHYRPNNIRLWKAYEKQEITKQELMNERFVGVFRGVADIAIEHLEVMNQDFLGRIVLKSSLIDGAIDLLDYLKSKYRLCVLSNGFTEMQYVKIKSAGLDGYFDEIVLSDVVGINKPQAGIFDYALRKLNASKSEVIMLGDNYSSDIVGARNANIEQIWYNPKKQDPADFDPTYTIEHLSEVKTIL